MNNMLPMVQIDGAVVFEYFNGMRQEMNSPFNEWVAGEKVGHSPSNEEKLVHYFANYADVAYRRHFIASHPGLCLAA